MRGEADGTTGPGTVVGGARAGEGLQLEGLPFDNTYARLPGAYYVRLDPTPLPRPELVAFNPDAAALIGLDPAEAARPEFADYFSGNRRLPGSDPLAMLYAGHQFGHYVSQLGDGRAILLGEVRGADGVAWDLHLKGAGHTPFSRDGDGRAVLRSTVREYLACEALHGLGIPSTRALCIVAGDEEVYRERIERGAMLLRLAPSHVRFGSFEVFYYREQYHRLGELADYVIDHDFPHLTAAPDRYRRLLAEVVERTADLVAGWQAVGFAHGVMNTDNMSILGITLDYGPYGLLDEYDPGFVCNHSDRWGRYAFDRQPHVAHWNLGRLAQAMLPVLAPEPEKAAEVAYDLIGPYQARYAESYLKRMRAKLGLREAREGDQALLDRLLHLLAASRVDYAIFFRSLGTFRQAAGERSDRVRDQFLDRDGFDAWARDYRARLVSEGSDDRRRQAHMDRENPRYVLRNYLAQKAIAAADGGDYAEVERLRRLLAKPFDEHPGMESYADYPPDWARRIVVSCSS